MTITNNHQFPDFLVKALTHKDWGYQELPHGDISVSALLDAPQIRLLRKRHKNELEEDVIDFVWRRMGDAVHSVFSDAFVKISPKLSFSKGTAILEYESFSSDGSVTLGIKREVFAPMQDDFSANDYALKALARLKELNTEYECSSSYKDEYYIEKEFIAMVNGWRLKMRTDMYNKKLNAIIDWKYTSVWSYIYGEKWEWQTQLNMYRWIMLANGENPINLYNVCIFRDWKESEYAKSPDDYPPCKVMVIPQMQLPIPQIKEAIDRRIIFHQQAEQYIDMELPECSMTEKWARPDTWAVKKPGAKRATRVCHTEDDAKDMITRDQSMVIEYRPGENKRCETFCPVNKFCFQRKREHQKQ